MRLVLTSQQISFYREKGFIEFENLLSLEESKRARLSAKMFFEKTLNIAPDEFISHPVSSFIEEGRDLFLQDAYLKKITLRRSLAEIASSLSQAKILRLGFEQVFYTNAQMYPPFASPFYPKDYFPLQGLEILLCIRLSFSKKESEENSFLPKNQGSGLFFSPESLLDLRPIFTTSSQYFLWIGYVNKGARFIEKEKNSFSFYLKKQGYATGDLLKEPHHPIVFQKQHNWL